MTPAARLAAAIAVLDDILGGQAAEPALVRWARGNRYAGSGDRAAVRDHVFDVLRALRSLAALGGGKTGRALMLGLMRRDGADIPALFTGQGYAPPPLTPEETQALAQTPAMSPAEACDMPDWLWPAWTQALGDAAGAAARIQQQRAALILRVNGRRTTRAAAAAALAAGGVATVPVAGCDTALKVTENERRVAQSDAYLSGLVEVQDTASQRAVAALPLRAGMSVLDYCAGGGGKALAIADRADVKVTAHDIAPARMQDLPARAARAGVGISLAAPGAVAGRFDLVLVDAPCSGSGTWRRTPEAKWALTPDRLAELTATQDAVLRQAAARVAPGGVLAYATCSVLTVENDDRIADFLYRDPAWIAQEPLRLFPDTDHDGFFLRCLVSA